MTEPAKRPHRGGGKKTPRKKTVAQKREESGEEPEVLHEIEVVEPEDQVLHGEIIDVDGDPTVPLPVTQKKQVTAAERKRQAMQLRLMGASYQSIADQLGYADSSGAYQAVKSGMSAAMKDSAVDLRNATYIQLQTLFMVHWAKALKGDERAGVMCMQIQDRIRSLMGLDGLPVGEEISVEGVLVVGGDKNEYLDAMQKLRQQNHKEQSQ